MFVFYFCKLWYFCVVNNVSDILDVCQSISLCQLPSCTCIFKSTKNAIFRQRWKIFPSHTCAWTCTHTNRTVEAHMVLSRMGDSVIVEKAKQEAELLSKMSERALLAPGGFWISLRSWGKKKKQTNTTVSVSHWALKKIKFLFSPFLPCPVHPYRHKSHWRWMTMTQLFWGELLFK